jgi:hypothetical protein
MYTRMCLHILVAGAPSKTCLAAAWTHENRCEHSGTMTKQAGCIWSASSACASTVRCMQGVVEEGSCYWLRH